VETLDNSRKPLTNNESLREKKLRLAQDSVSYGFLTSLVAKARHFAHVQNLSWQEQELSTEEMLVTRAHLKA